MSQSYVYTHNLQVSHESLIRVPTWLIHVCAMTHAWGTWLIYASVMTYPLQFCVTWLIHAQYDPRIRVSTWLTHNCSSSLFTRCSSLCSHHSNSFKMSDNARFYDHNHHIHTIYILCPICVRCSALCAHYSTSSILLWHSTLCGNLSRYTTSPRYGRIFSFLI